jgi:hypothetical protein
MHLAMTTQTSRMRSLACFLAFATWVSLGIAASCSSDDQATAQGRVEHPVESGRTAAPGPAKAPTPPPTLVPPEASTAVTSAPSVERPLSLSEKFEKRTGMKLSPIEKAIMDECPDHAWSTKVPKRHCAKDSECGDGYCDRGRCAAIWTCGSNYGQRCESDPHCSLVPCMDGRCRSCASDAECVRVTSDGDAKCWPNPDIPGARRCYGNIAPSVMPQAVPASGSGASDASP